MVAHGCQRIVIHPFHVQLDEALPHRVPGRCVQSYFSLNTGEPYSPYSMLDLPVVYARYKTLFQGL